MTNETTPTPSIVNKELIAEFCQKFPARYLTLKTYRKLSERDRQFHLFNHWNILHDNGINMFHSYMNGRTGEKEHLIGSMSLESMGNIVYVTYKESFILFKRSQGMLRGIYMGNELSTFSRITEKEVFLHSKGMTFTRNIVNLSMNINEPIYKKYNAFTNEEIK